MVFTGWRRSRFCALIVSLIVLFSGHVAALTVGVETPLGQAFVDTYWKPTFANMTDGDIKMIPIQKDDDIYGLLPQLDLIVGSATLMNCVQITAPYFALSSLVQFEKNVSSFLVGGIIFVRKESDIYTLSDLRGKSVAFPQITYQVSAQAQASEMKLKAGVDLFYDTSFLVETGTYTDVIMDVQSGFVDTGLVRSGQLEQFTAVNASNFRILNQYNVDYQWATSVQPQPTTLLLCSNNLTADLRADIASHLLNIQPTDVAAKLGNYTAWIPPQNYVNVIQTQVNLGTMMGFENPGKTTCITNGDIYGYLLCPSGYEKKHVACPVSCPDYYFCVCNPCVKKRPLILEITLPIVFALVVTALFVLWVVNSTSLYNRCDREKVVVYDDSCLGRSRMGCVRKGCYYNSEVAVKTVTATVGRRAVRKVNRVTKQATHHNHVNVMSVTGAFTSSLGHGTRVKGISVVLPYYHSTLYDLLFNRLVKIQPHQQMAMLANVTDGLAYLHEQGVYGRKLRTAHLFVDRNWQVVIGISFNGDQDIDWRDAPELAVKGNAPTAQSDIFALGMLFYVVLYRRQPYEHRMAWDNKGWRMPDFMGRQDDVQAVMTQCWSFDPSDRPTLEDVQGLLARYQRVSVASDFTQDRDSNKDLLKQRLPFEVSAQIQNNLIVEERVYECVSLLSISLVNNVLTHKMSSPDFAHICERTRAIVDSVAASQNVVGLHTTDGSFLLVANLHQQQPDHVLRIVHTAMKIRDVSARHPLKIGKHAVVPNMRIGIHMGEVTGTVLGHNPPAYCLLGVTVTTVFRIRESCENDSIHVSEDVVTKLGDTSFKCQPRTGTLTRDGQADLQTYWVQTPQTSLTNTPIVRRPSFARLN